MDVTYGEAYGSLPTTSRTGYSFSGWFSAKTGGSRITYDDKVGYSSEGSTLYARWQAKKYTVNFDPTGGTVVGTTSKTVTYGGTYSILPARNPTREGYTFDGWYTAKDGGTKVTADTKVTATADHTLYAHWTPIPAEPIRIFDDLLDQTINYGQDVVSIGYYHPAGDYTVTRTWYECDADGSNARPMLNPDWPKVPPAGVHYYYVVVTSTRNDNGESASVQSRTAKVIVNKATPTISTYPTASAIDLVNGRLLSGSTLSGGTAENRNASPTLTVPGTFAWKDGSTKITKTGTQKFTVVFTPNDTANYTTAEIQVSVNVTCSHSFGEWSGGKRTCSVCGETETRTNTVTITWGGLAYTYEDGDWDPASHAYTGGGWSPDSPGGDTITVTNEGAQAVSVSFAYTQTNGSISGSFESGVSAVTAVSLPVSGTREVRLVLTGTPDGALSNETIGTVTVRLGGGG